ncbi:SDR family oxidoreductase [Mariniblastus sp.]|nr:SDR family oxidoreductase [Mariniblastus sp.]
MSQSISNESSPVCLVTGGSSGIGLAVSRRFAAEGYQLAICGRDEKKLAAAVQVIDQVALDAGHANKVFQFVADLIDVEQAKSFASATLDRFGQVDVLVNNAGLAPLVEFDAMSPESFEATTNVNIRSVFYLTQMIWKAMKQRPESETATVVNISSLSAIDPFPGFSLYGASKAWIDLLTEALATEGDPLGIRVCSVRPGAVETPLLRGLFPDFPPDQCVSPDTVAETVWGCVAKPTDFPSGGHYTVSTQIE